MCAGCPDTVTINMPDGPPYTAGDVLTCSSDGYPATYVWEVDGNEVSTTYTHALVEDEHEYECIVTVTLEGGTSCFESDTRTVTAYSKYHIQKQHNNTVVNVTV